MWIGRRWKGRGSVTGERLTGRRRARAPAVRPTGRQTVGVNAACLARTRVDATTTGWVACGLYSSPRIKPVIWRISLSAMDKSSSTRHYFTTTLDLRCMDCHSVGSIAVIYPLIAAYWTCFYRALAQIFHHHYHHQFQTARLTRFHFVAPYGAPYWPYEKRATTRGFSMTARFHSTAAEG